MWWQNTHSLHDPGKPQSALRGLASRPFPGFFATDYNQETGFPAEALWGEVAYAPGRHQGALPGS